MTEILSGVEEIISDASNGRMFILIDDDDGRASGGDLVIPAQMATPDTINFMARFGRGLICLAVTRSRVEELGLSLMSRETSPERAAAFTTSIEARDGVTTGISAADRAHTIAVAIDANRGADEIVTPGHVFPLMAVDGGVLVRAGHTEAAVDVARLAGLNPSGVICQIMNENGEVAQPGELAIFAKHHNLRIGTIRDLIAYRRRHDRLVHCVARREFESVYGGRWFSYVYANRIDNSENLVVQKGEIRADRPTLVRIHNVSAFSDLLAEAGPRMGLLERAMKAIGAEGSGVLVLLRDPRIEMRTHLTVDSMPPAGPAIRNYGIGAQILADLGIHEMILLTNSEKTIVGLRGFGLDIVEERSF